jgi:Tol biopolymer transport system component
MTPALHDLALSRDETQLLGTFGGEAWLVDLQQEVGTRFLKDALMPYWSADAKHIAFTTERGNVSTLYVHVGSTAGDLADQLVFKSSERKFMNDWTADGRYMVFVAENQKTKQDLWVLPTFGDRTPRPFLNTPANEVQGQVSPDGDRIAYASDESGQLEVYLDSFPTHGTRIVISNGGGGQPQWRRDGRELFYLDASGSLMAVDIDPSRPKVGAPRVLFQMRLPGNLLDSRNYYTPSGDGRHFFVTSLDDEAAAEPLRVLTNWTAGLHR